jgi:pimeloyl-ACP methyl ester carboxylesterase
MPAVAWHEKPSYGIVSTLDRTLSPDLERFMYARSKAKVVEIKSGHVPHMSHPDAVAAVIEEAAAGK